MKKLILGILIIGSSAVYANTPDNGGNRGRYPGYENLKKELSLTEDQIKALNQIKENYKGKYLEVRNNAGLTEEQKRTEYRKIFNAGKTEAREILTDEQLARLQQKRAEYVKEQKAQTDKKARKGKRGYKDAEARMKRMQNELKLDDQQVSAWNDLNETYAGKFREIRSNESLSEEQKRVEKRALVKQKNEDLKKVLSEEQYTKYQKMQSEGRKHRKGRS